MAYELVNCTNTLISEIDNKRMRRRDIAKTYALAILSKEPTDWDLVNKSILERWSESGLMVIKELAWKIVDGTN